jgi:hypothetical protein
MWSYSSNHLASYGVVLKLTYISVMALRHLAFRVPVLELFPF